MAYSYVHVWVDGDRLEVEAYAGSRRQRGAAIGAVVRGGGWKLAHKHYSETYGFQSATYAGYQRRDGGV